MQFSENIKTIIKIQRNQLNGSQALNSFLLQFRPFFFDIQKKIIYQIMRVQPKKQTEMQENRQKFSIFKFLYFHVDLHFISLFSLSHFRAVQFLRCFLFREAIEKVKEEKAAANVVFHEKKSDTANRRRREKKRRQQAIYFELSFKCWWFFFINFAVAFHPLFDMWRDVQGDVVMIETLVIIVTLVMIAINLKECS